MSFLKKLFGKQEPKQNASDENRQQARNAMDNAKTQQRYAKDAWDNYRTQLRYAKDADEKVAMYLRWAAEH